MHVCSKHLRDVDNGGRGHCCFETVAQAFAIGEGWAVGLVERAFVDGASEQLFRLRAALRRMTIAAFDVSENPLVTEDLEGEQIAVDEAAIRRLALDYC